MKLSDHKEAVDYIISEIDGTHGVWVRNTSYPDGSPVTIKRVEGHGIVATRIFQYCAKYFGGENGHHN